MMIKMCQGCHKETPHNEISRPDTKHEAELRCSVCGRFWGWKAKEKNTGNRPRNKHTPESLDISECQLCRRSSDHLGTNEILEVHHIIEISKNGEDVPENIWVLCSSCHSLVHHQRTYLNEHMRNVWSGYEELKQLLCKYDMDSDSYDIILSNIRSKLGI